MLTRSYFVSNSILKLIVLIAASEVFSFPQGEKLDSTELSKTLDPLALVYGNFTYGIIEAIHQHSPQDVGKGGDVGQAPTNSANSEFGLGHILAVIHENVWKVSVPIFDNLLQNTPKILPDAFEHLLNSFSEDSNEIKSTITIFSSDKIPLAPGLEKLKVEVTVTDLSQKESISTINEKISGKLSRHIDESYIPTGFSISTAAKAIIANTFEATGTWRNPVQKVTGKQKFNDVEDVDMVEIHGDFQVVETPNGIEVVMPFKNEKRALSLFLPNDAEKAAQSEGVEPKFSNITDLRIRLPLFTFSARRNNYNITQQCDFRKEENFLEILDEVMYVSLNVDNFNAISIKGAQVSNRESFKKESSTVKYSVTTSQSTQASLQMKSTITRESVNLSQKLVVVNRPFAWSFLDEKLGITFSGMVTSVASDKAVLTVYSDSGVFGMTSELLYSQCL